MNPYRFVFVIDLPDYASRTTLVRLMEDAAEAYGCEVQGQVDYERLEPPLKALPGRGTDGD